MSRTCRGARIRGGLLAKGRAESSRLDEASGLRRRAGASQCGRPRRASGRRHLEIFAMDLRLQEKRALVTGSSIGLGEAIARALAAEGVAVAAIHGRQPKRTYAVAADIEAHGGRVAVVPGDLTVEGEAQNIADSTIEQLGGIDILVNNAGGTGEKLVWEDTPIRAWTDSYERNVLAAVRLISRLLLPMRQSGWGRIVNVSSVAGVMPQPTGPDYSASKAAINNLSLSLTKALGASGVTVNTVSPGMILTPN